MKKNQQLLKSRINLVKAIMVALLIVLGGISNYVFAQNWDEIIKTVASDRGTGDGFGSVAISGEYAIIGASSDDQDATGGNPLTDAGSAYIFKNIAGTWTQIQKIVASDRVAVASFGKSVDISKDYAIVGAFWHSEDATEGNYLQFVGSAYIFKNIAGTWIEVQKIVASDRDAMDNFGYPVAIKGEYAIVGALHDEHDATGGNSLTGAGSAYIFKNAAGTWTEVQKIVASDRGAWDYFGTSVAISGEYVIVGAYKEDEDAEGGNTLDDSGSAYVFKNNSGTWTEIQKIVASDRGAISHFGISLSMSENYAIVGAHWESEDATGGNTLSTAGSAYIFKNNAGTWTEVQKIVASDRWLEDAFGISVAISEDYAIVGAHLEEEDAEGENTLDRAGSAYVFKNYSGTWSEVQKIVASDREALAHFGNSVAISGDYAIVGAHCESEDATGGNYLSCAGAAYIFKNITTVGIVENSFGNNLLIYPNPTNGNFSIDLGAIYENAQISITDISGKLIESKTIAQSQLLNRAIEEPAGIYLISVQAGSKKAVIRLVKQ